MLRPMNHIETAFTGETELDALTVVGFSIRTTNAEAAQTIPPLWHKVMSSDLLRTVPDARCEIKGEDEVPLVALYGEYESDHTGAYTLTVGVLVSKDHIAGPGMTMRAVPKQRYARIEARGEPAAATWAAWQWAWRELSPRRAFTADLEIHRPSCAMTGPVELLVALAP